MTQQTVNYYIYEQEMARSERHCRRWMIALCITNALWAAIVFL